MKELLKENFIKYFKKEPSYYYFSPGRVNLIGEHIDYNGGMVFPFGVTLSSLCNSNKNCSSFFYKL